MAGKTGPTRGRRGGKDRSGKGAESGAARARGKQARPRRAASGGTGPLQGERALLQHRLRRQQNPHLAGVEIQGASADSSIDAPMVKAPAAMMTWLS